MVKRNVLEMAQGDESNNADFEQTFSRWCEMKTKVGKILLHLKGK